MGGNAPHIAATERKAAATEQRSARIAEMMDRYLGEAR